MPKSQAVVIEDLVSEFRDKLAVIVAQARRETIRTLADRLSVVDGLVARTRTNTRVLQSVDAIFQREMDRAGYRRMVRGYVRSFNGQFEFFKQTLDRLGVDLGRDVSVRFGPRDKAAFVQQQVSAARLIDGVVDGVAASAERQAMMSIGGLKLADLITAVSQKLDATVGQATNIADTALSVFYRTIQDRGFQIVERSLPDSVEVRYTYGGPDDRLVRPFCRHLLDETAKGTQWTRAQIDAMRNGQLPNVFYTGGGWKCRHQWLLQPIREIA